MYLQKRRNGQRGSEMILVIDIFLRFNLYAFIQSWGRKLIETMGTEANIRIIQVSLTNSTQYHSRQSCSL